MPRVALDAWELGEIYFALRGHAEDGAYLSEEEGGIKTAEESQKAERMMRKIERAWKRA